MSTEENKHKENTNTSVDSGFMKMDQMMSQMMNMCCTGKGKFSECITMMKNGMKQMKNQSQPASHEANNKSEEKKK